MSTRASLSISEPNEQWVQAQIDSKEFSSRSEVINDLIRKAREIDFIRHKLISAELTARQGWVEQSADSILDEFKYKARHDAKL